MGGPALRELLLLSGGLDSAAVAAWRRPAATLTINYGQRPAAGEIRAAKEVARELNVENHVLVADCSNVGSGLMAGSVPLPQAPSREWWPYRNQLLATLAATWALSRGFDAIIFGSVRSDGFHVDATKSFYRALDALIAMQEGRLRVIAPALDLTSSELIIASGIPYATLAWTTSCHRGSSACGDCPGCQKHSEILRELNRR